MCGEIEREHHGLGSRPKLKTYLTYLLQLKTKVHTSRTRHVIFSLIFFLTSIYGIALLFVFLFP